MFRYWLQPFSDHPQKSSYDKALREAPRSWKELRPQKALAIDHREGPYLDRWAFWLELPCQVDKHAWRLVDTAAVRGAVDWAMQGNSRSGWAVYSDGRAFVWTCALVGEGANAFGDASEPEASGSWVRLLNVDRPEDGPASPFEQAWARERTYRRWLHRGTLYGFNSHSGAMVAPPVSEPPLWRHFAGPYFDHTLLLLYLRIGLFRFSRWLADASARARMRDIAGVGERDEDFEEELRQIRKSFTLFTNLYQYPLLSNQQQAVEMYSLARQVMDLPELFAEVHEQIKTSHEFLDMEADHVEVQAARRLNVVATAGLAVALAMGFLSMNIISNGLVGGTWSRQGFEEWKVFVAVVAVIWLLMTFLVRRWRPVERLLFGRPWRRRAGKKEVAQP